MKRAIDISGYPLSPALTQRVVNYLNYFRLFISVLLSISYLSGVLVQQAITDSTMAATMLLVYFIFSLYFVFSARRDNDDFYMLALQSLMLDVFLIAVLLQFFSGVAVLLVFVGASAGIILPLRLALLVASLAALAMVTQPLFASLLGDPDSGDLLTGGFYGLTILIITALTHALATWARDFRLIAERQMRTVNRLEQINELVIRRLRSGVLAVSPEGEIRMMNESAWFLLGSPSAAERDLAKVSPELLEELELWRKDPRQEPVTLNLNASQADVVPKFVSLPEGKDVSTIIFLEDNDVVSQRALEMSSISLAKLSTSIAHEIRNPLAAVANAAQLLEEDEGLDESQGRLIEIIRNQSKRMNGIIENILQLSRREKSQHELIPVKSWLKELVEEFNGAHSELPFGLDLGDGESILLKPSDPLAPNDNEIPPNEDEPSLMVLFDRSQLHQVLWKLMENAQQHLGDGNTDPQLDIRLMVHEDSSYCMISVEDNGEGIEADKIGDIFEPFFTTRKAGSGLGLYIARQLCEANQAELTVDSRPGWRTRFRIRMAIAAGGKDNVLELDRFRENA